MEYEWKKPLRDCIRDTYVHKPEEEWFDFTLSTAGLLNVTIVSDNFKDVPYQERREQIWNMLSELNAPTSTGFLSLYTIDDARIVELTRKSSQEEQAYSWSDVAEQVVNASEIANITQQKPRTPQTIAFYSFKGGVGRTTALAHVAAILALQGQKVVVVDLDLEAPGLSSALNLTPLPEHGIVDYFYERSYLPKDVEPNISISEIFGEIPIVNATGRLFVVPAGKLDLGYIAKSDDLRSAAITERGEDLWTTFYQDITAQLQPDVILVDSRTGFNEWGAFSLLRAADKAIIFLYPNEQNSAGIRLLMQTLEQRVPYYFVFSMVPAVKDVGPAMVEEQWRSLQAGRNPNIQSEVTSMKDANQIIVPYLTAVALAKSYPVHDLLSYYQPIADIVYENINEVRLRHQLADQEQRRTLLQSLTFLDSHEDEKEHMDFYFQRTANFDKLLDENVCLVLGHGGTGKSTLCTLFLKHKDEAMDCSHLTTP